MGTFSFSDRSSWLCLGLAWFVSGPGPHAPSTRSQIAWPHSLHDEPLGATHIRPSPRKMVCYLDPRLDLLHQTLTETIWTQPLAPDPIGLQSSVSARTCRSWPPGMCLDPTSSPGPRPRWSSPCTLLSQLPPRCSLPRSGPWWAPRPHTRDAVPLSRMWARLGHLLIGVLVHVVGAPGPDRGRTSLHSGPDTATFQHRAEWNLWWVSGSVLDYKNILSSLE